MPTEPIVSNDFKICAGCNTQVGYPARCCPNCRSEQFDPVLMEPPWSQLSLGRRVYWVFIFSSAALLFIGGVVLVFGYASQFIQYIRDRL